MSWALKEERKGAVAAGEEDPGHAERFEGRKSFLSRSACLPLKQKAANKCIGKEITRSWRRLDGSCETNLKLYPERWGKALGDCEWKMYDAL